MLIFSRRNDRGFLQTMGPLEWREGFKGEFCFGLMFDTRDLPMM